MNKKTICKSQVELMEVHQINDGELFVLEITDFGHGMVSDYRVIPKVMVEELLAKINDKTYCSNLIRNRTKLRPFHFPNKASG